MKMFNILILVLAITVGDCFFDKENVCINDESRCTGMYDKSSLKYTKNCEKITCQSPLTYDCTENFCAKNMKDCKFLNWHSSIFKSNTEKYSFHKCFIRSAINSTLQMFP